MPTIKWFDEKYANGGELSPIDIVNMLKETKRTRLSGRAVRTLQDELKQWLYEFQARDGYTPSRHCNICVRINELAQLTNLDERTLKSYVDLYTKILEKHGDAVVLRFALEKKD
jgi:hypothetical protein